MTTSSIGTTKCSCFTPLVRNPNCRGIIFSLKYARVSAKLFLRVMSNICQHHTGFYSLPVFRNNTQAMPGLPPSAGGICGLRSSQIIVDPRQSVYSGSTAVTYVDEDFYGREGDVLRSMGYSRCFCLGLISIGVSQWPHPAAAQDFTPVPTSGRVPFTFGSFFAKLWERFLRR